MKIKNSNIIMILALLGVIFITFCIRIYDDNKKIKELSNKVEEVEKEEENQVEMYNKLHSDYDVLDETYQETRSELYELQYHVDIAELYEDILGFDINNIKEVDKKNWYYYSLLNRRQKEIYEKALQSIVLQLNCEIENSTSNEVTTIIESIQLDHPELFYIDFQNRETIIYDERTDIYKIYGIKYTGLESVEEIDIAWKEIKEFEEKALQNINEFMSEEEIEKHIFNFIVLKTCYIKDTEYNQSIYSVVKQETVCAGYAKMFKYLCNKAGIKCICVRGEHNETGYRHLWNITQINNVNYMVDCTNALSSDKDKNVYISYSFFNTSSDFMERFYHVDTWARMPEVIHK